MLAFNGHILVTNAGACQQRYYHSPHTKLPLRITIKRLLSMMIPGELGGEPWIRVAEIPHVWWIWSILAFLVIYYRLPRPEVLLYELMLTAMQGVGATNSGGRGRSQEWKG